MVIRILPETPPLIVTPVRFPFTKFPEPVNVTIPLWPESWPTAYVIGLEDVPALGVQLLTLYVWPLLPPLK